MRRSRRAQVTILQPGGTAPPDPGDPDHPDRHQEVGAHFLPNTGDLAVVVESPGVVPDGFTRVPLAVVVDVVRDLCIRRLSMLPGEGSRVLLYHSRGDFLCAREGSDSLWLAAGRPGVDLARVLHIPLVPMPRAEYRGGGRLDRPGPEQLLELARSDAKEVWCWHVHRDGRTWRAGTEWPAPEPPDGPVEMLSARERRSISRCLRTALDDLPKSVLADGITMSFTTDGTPAGLGFTPHPVDHHISVTLTLDSDPADVDPFLDRVRKCPSGRVHILDPVA